MGPRPVRIGIVGAGKNTCEKHIPRLQSIPGVEVVSVCNRTRQSSERVAAQFKIPNVYNHWQALVRAPEADAIVIGAWPYLHCPVTVAALSHGKHVLCEARMAMNLEEARVMLAAAQAKPRLVAQLVPAPFTLGIDPTIRHLEDQGFLGKPLALEVRSSPGAFLEPTAPMHWRQDKALSGLNVMTLGIWYETVMRWFGEARRVTAAGRIFVERRRDAEHRATRAVEIPDHLDVIAEMACGAQAHFQMSAVAGLTPVNEALIWGAEGTLVVRDGKLFGGRRGDSQLAELPRTPDIGDGWKVEAEFIDALRGAGQVERTTFEDGVRYMEFTEAVWRSMEKGRAVDLPLQARK